jgi:O-antigen/teichoic acid export membrane protein
MIVIRRFASNAITSVVQTLISVLILFVLYRYLIRHLGPEQLGLWSLVIASASVARLSDMGLTGSIVKFVARYRAIKDDLQVAEVIQTATIFITCVMAVFCFIGYYFLPKILVLFIPDTSIPLAVKVLPLALTSLWVGSLASIFQSALDGCQRMDLRNIVIVLSNIAFLIAAIFGVSNFGIIGLAFAQLFQSSFLLLLSWLVIRKEIVSLGASPFQWNKNKFKEMYSYALNFQINSIAILLFDPVSKLLMSRYGGLSSAGYYEMASQMVLRLRSLIVAAMQPLVATVAELQEKSPNKICKLYTNFYRLTFFATLIFYVAIFIFMPLFSFFWLGYFETKFLFFGIFLIIGWAINNLTTPAYFFNLGTGDLKWNSITHVLMGFLNVILCLILGPKFGDLGVVVAAMFSLIFCSILNLHVLLKKYEIPLKTLIPSEHLKLLITLICFLAISLYFNPIFNMALKKIFYNIIIFLVIASVAIWFHPYRLGLKFIITKSSHK